ncbi:hypothetical protein OR214_02354 [Ralstonia pickettii OR214]|jgi:hypothetical protein|uniref:Uncharacterized protein n=3 Tax=Ralstonia TaxID=48736 RepID=R0DXD0_RALPI|nr:hypothetical protein [Ralstonia pickettii]ENZ78078.1 hypothetical protein OR214_02354 [Ralstonia pickettii OR214]
MTPTSDVLRLLQPAFEPCAGFQGEACSQNTWDPQAGHVPRGFCGAVGGVSDIKLVLVCAEPGDPHPSENHASDGTAAGRLRSVSHYALECVRNGNDRFHKNLRTILDLCWPDTDFETQMRWTWITDSVLCSAKKEGGRFPVRVERECAKRFLVPQISLFPGAIVAALGKKAEHRMRQAGIVDFVAAGAAAPPGCNQAGVRESWHHLAGIVHVRFPTQANTEKSTFMNQLPTHRPMKEFEAFAQAAVLAQTESSHPDPIDVFVQSLWHAAELDWFHQTGKHKKLLDAGGLPRDEAYLYAALIQLCKSLVEAGPTAAISYDEYHKLVAEKASTRVGR